MMFSVVVFGFGYLLLWHYSCLPLTFLPVYYTSALFEIQKYNWRKVIEKYVKWFVFIIYPPCPVWFSLLCNRSEISGSPPVPFFIIKMNTKCAFSFVSYLPGYECFKIVANNLFFHCLKSPHLDEIFIVTMSQQSAEVLQIKCWEPFIVPLSKFFRS